MIDLVEDCQPWFGKRQTLTLQLIDEMENVLSDAGEHPPDLREGAGRLLYADGFRRGWNYAQKIGSPMGLPKAHVLQRSDYVDLSEANELVTRLGRVYR